MVITLQKLRYFIPALLLILITTGCSEKKQSEQPATTPEPVVETNLDFPDWKSTSYKNITVKYPAFHEEVEKMPDYAHKFEAILRKDCAFLNIPVPTDTLTIFMFNTVGDGRGKTGEMFPFYRNDSLFYWPPYNYGVVLGEKVISGWAKGETRFPFLHQGLLRLFDASGRNFHEMTLDYIDSSMFIPLEQLAADSTLDANLEFHRSVLAASFIDYLVFKYSSSHFALLYHAPTSFDSSTVGIFNITTDSLEHEWINTIKATFKR